MDTLVCMPLAGYKYHEYSSCDVYLFTIDCSEFIKVVLVINYSYSLVYALTKVEQCTSGHFQGFPPSCYCSIVLCYIVYTRACSLLVELIKSNYHLEDHFKHIQVRVL